ncbi:MAG: hypothetical protein ACLQME_03545 [Alphaproteobacteria bacterium]
MTKATRLQLVIPLVSMLAALSLSALAEEPKAPEHGHPQAHPAAPQGHPGPRIPFHAGPRDVRHFDPNRLAAWRGGLWRQEWHNGRYGWWWSVDGAWYFYPQPIYPYPMAVSDVYVEEPAVPPPPQYVMPFPYVPVPVPVPPIFSFSPWWHR